MTFVMGMENATLTKMMTNPRKMELVGISIFVRKVSYQRHHLEYYFKTMTNKHSPSETKSAQFENSLTGFSLLGISPFCCFIMRSILESK